MSDLVYFYPEGHAAHAAPAHPERPERVEAIRQGLEAAGWWQPYPKLAPLPTPPEVLCAVHRSEYLERLQAAGARGEPLDGDTYTTPASWKLALNSAGGGMAIARAVWQRQARYGFSLNRPAGHHATPERGMGFCLLNNAALAAEYLLQELGARRLAIIDLDLHHGNGTQEIFYQRPEVFYISIHQSPLFPGTGRLEETGAGPGLGTNANFPLPPATGDQGYRAVMDELILPLLDRFAPEMLLVSAGFDPHWRDPLGHLRVSAGEYGRLICALAEFANQRCDGRLALLLEGGYDLEASAACAQAAVAALLDQNWQDPLGFSPRPEGQSWKPVVRRAKEVWGL